LVNFLHLLHLCVGRESVRAYIRGCEGSIVSESIVRCNLLPAPKDVDLSDKGEVHNGNKFTEMLKSV